MFVSAIEFMIAPAQKTVAQGWEAGFNCQHSTADAIGWRLNGTTFLDRSLEGVSASSASLAGGVLNTLTIVAHPEYNQTRIGCVAFFDTGSPIEVTDTVVLIIQGL